MAKYFIRLDTYWQGSPDRWFGPYPTKDTALAACDGSGAGRADLGQMASDVKYQTRVLGIHNATESARMGRSPENSYPAVSKVPGDTDRLLTFEDRMERAGYFDPYADEACA